MFELFLKKYSWVLNLLFLLLAAFFVAKGVNAWVSASLAPEAALDEDGEAKKGRRSGARKPAKPAPGVTKDDRPIVARNLFNSKATDLEPIAESMPAEGKGHEERCASPASPASEGQLLGVAYSDDPAFSMAAIKTSADVDYSHIGEKVLGDATLTEVHTHWVCLERGGRTEYLDLIDEPKLKPAERKSSVPAPPGKAGAADAESDRYIAKLGDNSFAIDREFIRKKIEDPSDLIRGGRAIPHMKDGVADGFKLYAIRPDGLFYKLGVRNGDVIKTVNGEPINTIDQVLGLMKTLSDSSETTIGIDRRGSLVNMRYTIR